VKTGLNWRDTLAINASGQMPKSLPRSVSSIPMVCRNLTTDWIEFRLVAEIEGFSVMALYVSTPMLSRDFDSDDPFISAIELRVLQNGMYEQC